MRLDDDELGGCGGHTFEERDATALSAGTHAGRRLGRTLHMSSPPRPPEFFPLADRQGAMHHRRTRLAGI